MLFAQPIGLKLAIDSSRSVGSSETNRERERLVSRSINWLRLSSVLSRFYMRSGLMPRDPIAFDREYQARSETAAGAVGIAKELAIVWLDAASDRLRAAGSGSADGWPAPDFI